MSLAAMVLSLSLASNDTTAVALIEALYDLYAHPEYQAELRALETDGGCKKTTPLKMKMVLGTLLTEYDFKLTPAFEYNFPSPTARLLLRRKKTVKCEMA
ncbi:hypothetical protein BJX96DRAFT_174201 [Aspergillus floccosus]